MPRCETVYIWAVGSKTFYTPEKVGIQGGGATADNLVMQIHYDNQEQLDGHIDSSGVIMYHTIHKRQYDAGINVVGEILPRINIPPGNPNFEIENNCLNNCSISSVFIYTVALHMHLIGKKIHTEHWRNGVNLGYIGNEEQWDFNRQEQIRLENEIEVKIGDSFRTSCTYDSTNRTTVTRGGLSTYDEMCFNYIGFYPKQNGIRHCVAGCRV